VHLHIFYARELASVLHCLSIVGSCFIASLALALLYITDYYVSLSRTTTNYLLLSYRHWPVCRRHKAKAIPEETRQSEQYSA
jgi:hypothetical protein